MPAFQNSPVASRPWLAGLERMTAVHKRLVFKICASFREPIDQFAARSDVTRASPTLRAVSGPTYRCSAFSDVSPSLANSPEAIGRTRRSCLQPIPRRPGPQDLLCPQRTREHPHLVGPNAVGNE